jgi:N-acyl-D-amino-acid deacylase
VTVAFRELDIVLGDCRVVDGCGNPWYRGDIGVRGGRIRRIAPPGTLKATRMVDVDGRFVAPGFVDPHTHSDLSIITYPRADSAVRQGVTTHVTGNCGMSPAPVVDGRLDDLIQLWDFYGLIDCGIGWTWRSFGDYLREVEAAGPAINIAALVGHGALRVAALGLAPRAATVRELALMARLLARSMAAGAFGLSSGLVYSPGCYADTAELVALARVAARYNGIYASHVRGERETILEAVEEAIFIGREGGLPVEVSHNAPKWGAPDDAAANLALMEEARRRGQDVTTDNDSHPDLAPRLSRALPQPVLDLPHEGLIALLRDPERRADLKRDVAEDRLPGAGYTGLVRHRAFDRIVVLSAPAQPALTGRSIADIAAERGADAFDTFLDLILEEDDRVVGIFDYIEQDNIRALLTHRLSMCCSDGLVMPPVEQLEDELLYWPCSYGEYPGILERFVRDEPLLSLEDAVRRMTSFPAQRFGLLDRGVLRPGLAADIVVFDLDRIRDRATNPFPHGAPLVNVPPGYPEGIDYVLVNGLLVIDDGHHTGASAGRVLRHRGA